MIFSFASNSLIGRYASAAFFASLVSASAQISTAQDAVPIPQSSVPIPQASNPAQVSGAAGVVDRVVGVVGSTAITWSDVMAELNQQRAQGLRLPTDSAGQMELAKQILNSLIDQEILIQQARELKIEVTDPEVASQVERRIRDVRSQFPNDSVYRSELRLAGLGAPEEYRRMLTEQIRRAMLQQRAFYRLKESLKPAAVSEQEIDAAYEEARDQLRRRPATISFRQIIVNPKPSEAAKSVAKAKAEALLAELKAGADFELLAKRESADSGSAKVGGDLGWSRRGVMVMPFERAMFALPPGKLSNVVETNFGYHIIRVDRVQPGEVKARHILIAPQIDSTDIERARAQADTVAEKWRGGMPFDSLVAKYHDSQEEKGLLQPMTYDSLPVAYKLAVATHKAGSIADAFLLGTLATPKFAVVQVVTRTEQGEYSLTEMREYIRGQLSQERATRALLDELRQKTYVSLRL